MRKRATVFYVSLPAIYAAGWVECRHTTRPRNLEYLNRAGPRDIRWRIIGKTASGSPIINETNYGETGYFQVGTKWRRFKILAVPVRESCTFI